MTILPNETSNFETFVINFIKNAKEISLKELGKQLEIIDKALYIRRPKSLKIIKLKQRSILTSLGMLTFKRRYYYDELDEKYLYLLDAWMNIPKRSKLMFDIKLKLIEAASEMSYSKAGRYGSTDGYPISKSTVYRLIKNTDYYVEDNLSLINNSGTIHVQIDEKFMRFTESKNKKKHYTATIFKGVETIGKKRRLLNKILLSSNTQESLFKKINYYLVKKYRVNENEDIYISGDLASYIQTSPEKINVCKANYVPDKYHIKHALKEELGLLISDKELNNEPQLKQLIKVLNKVDSVDARKLRTLFKRNPNCLKAYMDPNYEGCSQECMNSHYYCPRFDNVPNKFNSNTIDRLSKIINAKNNNENIKLGFKNEYYETPIDVIGHYPLYEETKYDLDTREMKYETHLMFERIKYGY